ncbi:MAG: DUF3040 domain-containing protein [Nocardiopsaceae bacterium]|nr:DUF3040 domain-containing protein [Nocardiopsaceae bacterium]
MALREYERRILAEIEYRLCEDDPELAGHLKTFGADDPSFSRESEGNGWRPWVVCGIIVAVVVGLTVGLFLSAPSAPTEEPDRPADAPESGYSEYSEYPEYPVGSG